MLRRIVVGIRREDPKRVWERRAPLTPADVAYLLSRNPQADVLVAPCHRRVFRAEEYEKAGAHVTDDFRSADVVLGVKEVPLDELPLPSPTSPNNATHIMFSHTHKGQAYNTPLLSRFVAPTHSPERVKRLYPTLIDYELLKNADGERTVGFGWFAGVAGVLESLSSMAHCHLEQGIASPFLYTPRPHNSSSLKHAQHQLKAIGKLIAEHGTPEPLGPFVIGVTGSGNVSKGCLDMLKELPLKYVSVDQLEALVKNPDTDRRKIYLVHAKPSDYFKRTDGLAYDRTHYYESPQTYESVFHERVAPYLTLLLHGAGWAPGFPRVMTTTQLSLALEKARGLGGLRCTNIGDISCDIEGGLEFLTHSTTLSSPFFKFTPPSLASGGPLPQVQIMSVDILPTSLPYEASKTFSSKLAPYLSTLIQAKSGASPVAADKFKEKKREEQDPSQLSKALQDATIAQGGSLSARDAWLQPTVDKFYTGLGLTAATDFNASTPAAEEPTVTPEQAAPANESNGGRLKRILMLGSGMVAKPAVDMIAARPGIELVIASNSLPELQALVAAHPHVKYRVTDVSDPESYKHLVEESDVVISLLPVNFHPQVGQLCVDNGKHLVTASYISPAMAALDESAKSAGVLLLNEIGLDPGIDHCSAISLLSQIRSIGHEVVSFSSFCGGLPAPEDSLDVPLRYKFSWRPQGVLGAATNGASFLLGGELRNVPGQSLLRSAFPTVPITSSFGLEGLPNRDSMVYCDTYDLNASSMRTVIRGTLRYPGFSQLMHSFLQLGFLNTTTRIQIDRWEDFVKASLAAEYSSSSESAVPGITDLFSRDSEELHNLLEALTWLGLLSPSSSLSGSLGSQGRFAPSAIDRTSMPPLPKGPTTPLDLFAYVLSHKLRYGPEERDLVVLSHEIISRPITTLGSPAPTKETVHSSTLITYGSPTLGSAMSRTVGIPVAIAALLVAEDKVPASLRGVVGPMDQSVYKPVLEGLESVGLGMDESSKEVEVRDASSQDGMFGGAPTTIERALIDLGPAGPRRAFGSSGLSDAMESQAQAKRVEAQA
ncbi:hypothetical protein MD484_g6867, partial [Candolleomyces efflorescens]